MAIARVGATNGTATADATTVTVTRTVTAGNGLILLIASHGASAVTVGSVSDGTNSWTQAASIAAASGSTAGDLWYCKNVQASGSITVTVTWAAGASATGALTLIEVSGQDTSVFYDTGASTAASTASDNSGASGNLAASNEFLVGAVCGNGNNTFSSNSFSIGGAASGSGIETVSNSTTSGHKCQVAAFDMVNGTGGSSETFTVTDSTSTNSLTIVAAFKAASAAVATPSYVQTQDPPGLTSPINRPLAFQTWAPFGTPTTAISSADAATVTDAVILISQQAPFFIPTQDPPGLTSPVNRQLAFATWTPASYLTTIAGTDSATITDAETQIALGTLAEIGDTTTDTDAVGGIGLSGGDSGTGSDAVPGIGLSAADSVTITDTETLIALGTLAEIGDTVTVTDASAGITVYAPFFTAPQVPPGHQSPIQRPLGFATWAPFAQGAVQVNASDSATVTDQVTGIALSGIGDTLTGSDLATLIALANADSSAVTDTASGIGLSGADSAAESEAVGGIGLSGGDGGTGSEAIAGVALTATESAAITDAVLLIALASSDVTTATDAGTVLLLALDLPMLLAVTDTAVVAVAVTDQAVTSVAVQDQAVMAVAVTDFHQ